MPQWRQRSQQQQNQDSSDIFSCQLIFRPRQKSDIKKKTSANSVQSIIIIESINHLPFDQNHFRRTPKFQLLIVRFADRRMYSSAL